MNRAAKPRKAKSNGATLRFEATLWQAADKLRNNTDAAEYKHLFAHREPGSTVDRIWLKDFPSYPILRPSRECIAFFEATASQLCSQIHANQAEVRTLARLRDALLPRLLSGELSVTRAMEATE